MSAKYDFWHENEAFDGEFTVNEYGSDYCSFWFSQFFVFSQLFFLQCHTLYILRQQFFMCKNMHTINITEKKTATWTRMHVQCKILWNGLHHTHTPKTASIIGRTVYESYTISCNRLTACFRINIQLGNAFNCDCERLKCGRGIEKWSRIARLERLRTEQ